MDSIRVQERIALIRKEGIKHGKRNCENQRKLNQGNYEL